MKIFILRPCIMGAINQFIIALVVLILIVTFGRECWADERTQSDDESSSDEEEQLVQTDASYAEDVIYAEDMNSLANMEPS